MASSVTCVSFRSAVLGRCWIRGWSAAAQCGAQAPVDDLGLVDRRSRGRRTAVRQGASPTAQSTSAIVAARRGTRRGGGCRRPAPRSAPPSRPAGCAAPGRRRSAPAARRRPPGGRPSPRSAADGADDRVGVGVRVACTAASTATRGRVTRRAAPRSSCSSVVGGGHVRQSVAHSGTSQDWRAASPARDGRR